MSNMLKGYTKIQHWIDSPEIWFMDGQKAPNCKSLEELKQKPGAFFWDKANKKVLIHFPAGKSPANTKIEIPVYNTSICINTNYVEVSNLKSRYSWNDGFDTHGKGRNIKYRNCVASDNCGQAFSVHDTTSAFYENCIGFRNASTGITNVNKSYSLFRNCVISDNTFESGILGLEDSTTVFESCLITGNKPFEQIWQYKNSVLIFVNCYISPEDKNRGILNLERGRAIFDRCTFTNALFLASTNAKSSGELIITNSIIKDVRKIVYLHKEFPDKIVMKNNIISKGSVIEKSGEQFSPDKWNGLIAESENNLETDKIIQNSVYSSAWIKTNSDIDFQLEDAMKELIPAESLLNRKAEGKAGADIKELAEKYEVLKNKELNK